MLFDSFMHMPILTCSVTSFTGGEKTTFARPRTAQKSFQEAKRPQYSCCGSQGGNALQTTFAFTIHPTDISFVHRRWALTQVLPDGLTELILSLKPPFKVSNITGQTPSGPLSGLLMGIPLTTRMWHLLPEELLIKRVVRACQEAERLGAGLIGLGAHSAIPGDAGKEIARRVSIPVTTGNSLTVAAALEGVQEGARRMGHNLRTARVAVVGATGSIGSCCARILARTCPNLVLVGRSQEKLRDLGERILRESNVVCHYSTQVAPVLPKADVVVTVSSSTESIIDPLLLKPGAVVLDVAVPRDVDQRVAAMRNDVLVLDGGLMAIPGTFDLGYDVGLPPGVAWACLSETMLLALEGRFEAFTLGRDLTVGQVDEMARLARKHGFQLAQLRSFHRPVDELSLERIRRNAGKRPRHS